ncbi:MAG: DNA adenine methylase [Pseudomonadota bacterium]
MPRRLAPRLDDPPPAVSFENVTPARPLPMQYLGSKKRIARELLTAVRDSLPHTTTFVDLFGGTGAVALEARERRFRVHANDVQPYAQAVLRSLLVAPREGLRALLPRVEALRDEHALLAGARARMAALLAAETQHLEASDAGWQAYAAFCESTRLPEGRHGEPARLRAEHPWALFSTYYPNAYFGVRQCLQIDALAELAAGLPAHPRAHLLAATIAALTHVVSSTTHLAQFIKPQSATSVAALLKRRRQSVLERVLASLAALADDPRAPDPDSRVSGLDYLDALDALPLDARTVIYADPPYFKEHYSRYYHVLDTFVLYDWPALTWNPRTGRTTEGRYREDRIQSPFGQRAKVRGAFAALLARCHGAGAAVAISYADTSLVSRAELEALARDQGFAVDVRTFRLMHSGQGQPRNHDVTEQLFLLEPRRAVAVSLARLKDTLGAIEPWHDTPVGLVHPYWARKPLNVIQAVIEALTEPGDAVADPFLGSGTTAFAAAQAGRRAVGADLSPLAILLTRAVVHMGRDPEGCLTRLRRLVDEVAAAAAPWFDAGEGWVVERTRHRVEGAFAHGSFVLVPEEVVLKRQVGASLRGRRVVTPGEVCAIAPPRDLLNEPIDFDHLAIEPNSRIAVPEGAVAAHWFTLENRAVLNLARRVLDRIATCEDERAVLRLFISSAVPLLRLSDRKASSQWPYWRPRASLTSRNPIPVLTSRLASFEAAATWAAEHIGEGGIELHEGPVQRLPGRLGVRFPLVLTDPPYADQAPYLEYASMSLRIAGLGDAREGWGQEIVRTDAPGRRGDDAAYTARLREGLSAAAALVGPDGWCVLFYQDPKLAHWAALHDALVGAGLTLREVVHLPKQRRSMKTVTTPGRTLDGDLLVIAHRGEAPVPATWAPIPRDLDALIGGLPADLSFSERAAGLLRVALLEGWIGWLAAPPPVAAAPTGIRSLLSSDRPCPGGPHVPLRR